MPPTSSAPCTVVDVDTTRPGPGTGLISQRTKGLEPSLDHHPSPHRASHHAPTGQCHMSDIVVSMHYDTHNRGFSTHDGHRAGEGPR